MANAHLPNSHPDVTPDWIEPKRPLVPLAQALQTKRRAGTENVFEAFIPKDWCTASHVGWVAHGGYCGALIINTSKKYFSTRYPERDQPHPIHLHIQYLAPLPAGAVNLTITDLQLGSKHSVIQIALSSLSSSSKGPSTIALVTQGKLARTGNGNHGSQIDIPREQVPSREEDCNRWTDAQFFFTSPTSVRVRSYIVKGGPTPMWSPRVGKNKRDMWVKVDEEGKMMDLEHLGVIADLIPPLPLHYEKDALAGMARWAFPTMCLSLDIKRDPTGEEWLLQRTVMTECENGRYELDVKFVDDEGHIVATSKHSCLIIPRKGDEPEDSKYGSNSLKQAKL